MHADSSLIGLKQNQMIGYSSCFVGLEAVEWLTKTRQVDSRHAAVKLLRILEEHNILHHGQ